MESAVKHHELTATHLTTKIIRRALHILNLYSERVLQLRHGSIHLAASS